MEKGVIVIVFISLFILFGSVAFITAPPPPNGDENGDTNGGDGPTCTDTDGGRDYNVKGNCTDYWISYEDECSDGNTLMEYYCNIYSLCSVENEPDYKTCDGACVDGACVVDTGCIPATCSSLGSYDCGNWDDGCGITINCGSCDSEETCVGGICVAGVSCTDSDVTSEYPDGKNYNLRGTATGSNGVDRTDVCINSNDLLEYYCSGTDVTSPEDDWVCPLGCSEGACVTPTPGAGLCERSYIFSNINTQINGQISFPATTIGAWTADIPEARWIWEAIRTQNPEINETVVFTKTFTINDIGGTIDGVLEVAADNSYSCTLNGLFVGADANENNFEDTTQDKYSLGGKLRVGENTLVCEVKNWEQSGGTWETNPAGFLYGLSVSSGDCETATTCFDSDGGVNYFSPGTATESGESSTDSCSEDGSILTEYYCDRGEIAIRDLTAIDYLCDCIDDGAGGYCELSGAGLVCGDFSSHSRGGLIDATEMVGFVDEEIQDLLVSGDIAGLTLSEVPVKSRIENENIPGDNYYCGLDLLWHRVKPTVVDIACINDPDLNCLSDVACDEFVECDLDYSCVAGVDEYGQPIVDELDQTISFCDYDTSCLEDYECQSNSCVDGSCISISAELVAQRGILTSIWCAVTNLPSFISDGGVESEDYLQCMYESFGGV